MSFFDRFRGLSEAPRADEHAEPKTAPEEGAERVVSLLEAAAERDMLQRAQEHFTELQRQLEDARAEIDRLADTNRALVAEVAMLEAKGEGTVLGDLRRRLRDKDVLIAAMAEQLRRLTDLSMQCDQEASDVPGQDGTTQDGTGAP